jgi:hypothetical protein
MPDRDRSTQGEMPLFLSWFLHADDDEQQNGGTLNDRAVFHRTLLD